MKVEDLIKKYELMVEVLESQYMVEANETVCSIIQVQINYYSKFIEDLNEIDF